MLLGGDALSTYLNDHLAGATAGVELAGRIAPDLRPEIDQDRDTLLDIMDRLGAGRDQLKAIAAWGAEQARRARPGWLMYDGLGRLEELELLTLGVTGKLVMWEALRHALADDPRLAGVDLDVLAARARSQLERLDRRRLDAAATTLS
jgi:hypothetical protein